MKKGCFLGLLCLGILYGGGDVQLQAHDRPESYEVIFFKDREGNRIFVGECEDCVILDFKRIEAGSFKMGSSSGEPNRHSDEGNDAYEDREEIKISRSFDIMTKEVTQEEWFFFMEGNPSYFKKPGDCDDYTTTIGGVGLCPNNPVERVSWDDVQNFINLLNDSLNQGYCRQAPRYISGCYRLPTEAEWEYAARGETTTAYSAYSFGDDPLILGEYAWFSGNAKSKTHPVGLKRSNPNGLHDIHGNVWEWVQDTYSYFLPTGTDPLREDSGPNRVIRGGSWRNSAKLLRSANRHRIHPVREVRHIGFRLVRTL